MIRLALERDAEQIADIYAPVVRDTAISFEVEPPTAAEMSRRVADTLPAFPCLVVERLGEILGFVYARAHRARAAYRWSVDTTVYVHPGVHRGGVGRALYTSLLRILALQRFCTAYAGITLPNPGSVGLHEAVGFEKLAVYRGVGYKLGAWHDVGWWQRTLAARPPVPEAPLSMAVVEASSGWHAALTAGLPLLRV